MFLSNQCALSTQPNIASFHDFITKQAEFFVKIFFANPLNILNFEKLKRTMLLQQLKTSPETIDFKEVIAYIDGHYDFTPTKFTNGNTVNEAGENNGSRKIFSFAKLNKLSKDETLALFGDFYRTDVLKNPEGSDHQNIRNFQQFSWDEISFDGEALKILG